MAVWSAFSDEQLCFAVLRCVEDCAVYSDQSTEPPSNRIRWQILRVKTEQHSTQRAMHCTKKVKLGMPDGFFKHTNLYRGIAKQSKLRAALGTGTSFAVRLCESCEW